MLKLGHVRFRGKCPKHPGYDPHEGIGAIKGGCPRCERLFYIFKQHELLMLGKYKLRDDGQMGLFTEVA